MNYYEHHIGDYAEATAHLSFIEDAAYARLIRKYYAQEKPLPTDLKAVQRLVGARSKEEREAVDTVLNEFFSLDEDGWHNGRCDAELARYLGKTEGKDAKRENERERQRRHRQRRKELFDTLREHGEVPPFDVSTDELVTLLERVTSRNVTQPVTRDATANQTPDTSNHIPNPITPAPDDSTSVSAVGALSIAMRRFGISSDPGDLRLKALAEQGIAPDTVTAACEEAKRSKPNEAIKPGFVIAILQRWAREAAELKVNGAGQPRASPPTKHANTQRLLDRINRKEPHEPDDRIIDINDRPA